MLALLGIALAVAALTWSIGWWGVVIVALVAGFALRHRRGAAWLVALGAVVAWALLLVVDAVGGRFSTLARSIAGVMRLPVPALLLVTLLFAALLGWGAAVVGSEFGRRVRGAGPVA